MADHKNDWIQHKTGHISQSKMNYKPSKGNVYGAKGDTVSVGSPEGKKMLKYMQNNTSDSPKYYSKDVFNG